MLTNPIAIGIDGLPVHADDVEDGGSYTCPGCGAGMIHIATYSRRGARDTRAHFRHAHDEGCGTGGETALHLWAKMVIERHGKLTLPPRIIKYRDIVRRHKVEWTFTAAQSEPWMAGVRPDVLLIRPDGGLLHVEILVTHRTGEEKVSRLEQKGHSALEIDLSDHRVDAIGSKELEQAILRSAPRQWLGHESDSHWTEEAMEIWNRMVPAKAEQLLRMLGQIQQTPFAPLHALHGEEVAFWETEAYIGKQVLGSHWYRTDPREWQSFSLSLLLETLTDGETVATAAYEQEYDGVLDRDEVRNITTWPEIVAAAGFTPEEFGSPGRTVLTYLRGLCSEPVRHPCGANWLIAERDGVFVMHPHAFRYLRDKRTLASARDDIVWVHDKREERVFENWFDLPITPSGRSPRDICLDGGPAFFRMLAHMEALRNMKGFGSPAPHLLGLVDEEERERARTRNVTATRVLIVCPSHAMLKAGEKPQEVLFRMATRLFQSQDAAVGFLGTVREDMGGVAPTEFVIDVPTLQYAIARMPMDELLAGSTITSPKKRIW